MVDLFTVKSPLLVSYKNGEQHVVAELFPSEHGIAYLVPWWLAVEPPGVYLVEGDITGEGPWKVGDVIVRLMSCGDTEDSMYWTQWQQYLTGCPAESPYHDEELKLSLTRQGGRRV